MRKESFPFNSLFILFILLSNLFVFYFISNERCIYFWDFDTYWKKFELAGNTLIQDPTMALRHLRRSIRDDVYNDFPVYFLMPFRILFGYSRISYSLAILNIFAIPAIGLGWILFTKTLINDWANQAKTSGIALLSLFEFPFFWDPVLYGYLDVGGLIFIFLILKIYFARTWENQNIKKCLILGMLSAGLVLFRRWYFFWVFTFFLIAAVQITVAHWKSKTPLIWFQSALKLMIAGALSGLIYCAITWPLPVEMIKSNTSTTLSAWRFSQNLSQALWETLSHFGLFFTLSAAAGALISFRDSKTRTKTLFFLSQGVLIYLLFYHFQDFDVHHYYLLIPSILFFLTSFLGFVSSQFPRLLWVYAAGAMFCFFCVFLPILSPAADRLKPVTPSARHYPKIRQDIMEIQRLTQTLVSLASNDSDQIYVIASSDTLNSDILKNAEKNLGLARNIEKKVQWTHSVDKFDGFPDHFFDATIVVVAEPIQYHLNPKDQNVIRILAEEFLEQKSISANFEKIPDSFILDDKARVHVFKKIRDIGPDDANNLRKSAGLPN